MPIEHILTMAFHAESGLRTRLWTKGRLLLNLFWLRRSFWMLREGAERTIRSNIVTANWTFAVCGQPAVPGRRLSDALFTITSQSLVWDDIIVIGA